MNRLLVVLPMVMAAAPVLAQSEAVPPLPKPAVEASLPAKEGALVLSPGLEAVGIPAPGTFATVEQVKAGKKIADGVMGEVNRVIIGQTEAKKAIMMAKIADQHVLLEGLPGVGKTELAKAFADAADGSFSRIQGTPDKQPSDILGVEVVETDPETGKKRFVVKKGPIFANVLLVDEINRNIPKTQSSLLETMAEKQTTIGSQTFSAKTTGDFKHFMVIATQNPIEQDGTYPLPEAQLDRFMFKVVVPQPTEAELMKIADLNESSDNRPKAGRAATQDDMVALRRIAESIRVEDSVKTYINQVAMAASTLPGIKEKVEYTVYVRAAIRLRQAARLNALLEGRHYVTPGDVIAMAPLVLRHRIRVKYGEGNVEQIIEKILVTVPQPKIKE